MTTRAFPQELQGKTIGCIGCGNMGGAILGGLALHHELTLLGYNRTPSKLDHLALKGITPVADIASLAAKSDILILGVKPYMVTEALTKALPSLRPGTLVVSIAAGVSMAELQEACEYRFPVVRVMPNTPALVGSGIFALCLEDASLSEAEAKKITQLFDLLGKTLVLPEHRFGAFSALIGCGPAYVFYFIDALAEAGVTLGFTRQESIDLVNRLFLGSAKLGSLPGAHPAILREQVCSPAGLTINAINQMDRQAVRGHIIDAVLAAQPKH